MKQEYLDILEELDWTIGDRGSSGKSIEIWKCTPAGENFSVTVGTKDFASAILNITQEFDPEGHAHMQYGGNGAPSLHELVEDADWISDELRELADALLYGMEKKECWEFTDEKAEALRSYVEANFFVSPFRIVNGIIRYVAGQGLDKTGSVNLLMTLLDAIGIEKEEIDNIL